MEAIITEVVGFIIAMILIVSLFYFFGGTNTQEVTLMVITR